MSNCEANIVAAAAAPAKEVGMEKGTFMVRVQIEYND